MAWGRSCLERPAKASRPVRRAFALVEPMSVLASVGGVELQVRAAMLAGPLLGRIEQPLADAARAQSRVDGQVLDPRTTPKPDRLDVVVDGAEAGDSAVRIGNQDLGRVRAD